MRYTVRSPDGELTLPSRRALEEAFAQGLVGPEDEVREEGSTTWRKVGTLAGLRAARPAPRGPSRALLYQTLGVCLLGGVSLALILSGDTRRMMLGGLLALGTVSWLFSWTRKAFALRRRP